MSPQTGFLIEPSASPIEGRAISDLAPRSGRSPRQTQSLKAEDPEIWSKCRVVFRRAAGEVVLQPESKNAGESGSDGAIAPAFDRAVADPILGGESARARLPIRERKRRWSGPGPSAIQLENRGNDPWDAVFGPTPGTIRRRDLVVGGVWLATVIGSLGILMGQLVRGL